jgi:hypothetical protein
VIHISDGGHKVPQHQISGPCVTSSLAGIFLISHLDACLGFDSFIESASGAQEVCLEGGHWPWSTREGMCLDPCFIPHRSFIFPVPQNLTSSDFSGICFRL